jgi:hypothetical protein
MMVSTIDIWLIYNLRGITQKQIIKSIGLKYYNFLPYTAETFLDEEKKFCSRKLESSKNDF